MQNKHVLSTQSRKRSIVLAAVIFLTLTLWMPTIWPSSKTVSVAHAAHPNSIAAPTTSVVVDYGVTVENKQIDLHWSTTDETALLGFHVLRLAPDETEPVRVTGDADIILAQHSGLPNGASYSYQDASVTLDTGGGNDALRLFAFREA